MPNNLNEKKFVLVTGASSGIGKAIAVELSKSNNIILNGRDKSRLEETKNLCSKDFSHIIFNYDFNNTVNLEHSLSEFIKENNIVITKLVYCAGHMRMTPLKVATLNFVNDSFNVNIISPLLIVKTLVSKRYNKQVLENVVFISSNISNRGAKAFSIYSASKSGLDGLMRSLAMELAPRVRVNSVLPGAIATEMTKDTFSDEEKVKKMAVSYPLGLGKPQNIADAVVFLLSDKSSWITGQQLTVDGGRAINIGV